MTEEPPRTSPPAAPAEGPKKPATTVTAGTLIMGTYEIEKIINSGGMGEVYRGRNIHNDEPVAIKIVLPSLAHDTKIVALFQKESTVLSRLSHEAIVRYHVFTNDPTIGRPCMVMEFVSGTALSDRIEQGPMPLADVKVMLGRVASGLDKAHKAGVVHRDLSPDNVILEGGDVAHAKLIDFGIAKSTNIGAGTLLQGQFAGKFNWVSPEQLGAFGGHVDGRSDIYSLALITAGASRGKVLEMGASIVDAVGKRSSVPDLTGVDPALVPLLSWMLQPDPGLRTESMAKVIAALDDPSLIPQAKPAEPAAPDPNRTVIEPLPVFPPTAQTMPPMGAQTTPPQGRMQTSPPLQEPEDASPFGAPGASFVPPPSGAQSAAPVAAKKGKGGMVAVLALLAVAGGGAGAYYGGLLGPKTDGTEAVAKTDAPAETAATGTATASTEAATTEAATTEAATTEAAATDAAAAEKAAADKAAADQAAAVKAAVDEAATKAAEAKAQTDGIRAALGLAQAAKADAEKAASDAAVETLDAPAAKALADAAAIASEKGKAAAEAATTNLAAVIAAVDAATATGAPVEGLDALRAQAEADVKLAADASTAAKVAAEAAAGSAKTKADAAQAAAEAALSEKERAAKIEADAAAAAKEAQSQAEAVEAARNMAEGALAEAEKAAADAGVEAMDGAGAQALADAATAAARKARAAADAATAGLVVTASAVETAKRATAPVEGLDALRSKADTDATAAAAAAAAADNAVVAAAAAAKLKLDADAARLAEEQAKAEAANADPVPRQLAFLEAYVPPACSAVHVTAQKPEGFAMTGYGLDTKAMEELDAAWKTQTETEADITMRLVNEPQCSVLDFANRHPKAEPLTIEMTGTGSLIKSGKTIEGVIDGLNGRDFVLLYISPSGGATNMKDWLLPGEDGTMQFRFSLTLAKGPSPAPQMLVALVGGDALPKALEKLKSGSNAAGLFNYLDKQIDASGAAPAIGLGYFQLEE